MERGNLLLGIAVCSALCSCDIANGGSKRADRSWNASFRIESGAVSATQLAQATRVWVGASRGGVGIASAEVPFDAHSVTLTIPTPGDIEVKLIGYKDAGKDTVLWTGSGTIASHDTAPGKNAVYLTRGPGLIPYGSFVDGRDSHTYRTVQIGSQVWMAQNLDYDTLDGTGSMCFDDSAANCRKFGRLYTEALASAACPAGWHLPSNTDWKTLLNATGGRILSFRSTSGWPDSNGIDEFGFTVLPAGEYAMTGVFLPGGGAFWSSTSACYPWHAYVTFNSGGTANGVPFFGNASIPSECGVSDEYRFSVRCVRD